MIQVKSSEGSSGRVVIRTDKYVGSHCHQDLGLDWIKKLKERDVIENDTMFLV